MWPGYGLNGQSSILRSEIKFRFSHHIHTNKTTDPLSKGGVSLRVKSDLRVTMIIHSHTNIQHGVIWTTDSVFKQSTNKYLNSLF